MPDDLKTGILHRTHASEAPALRFLEPQQKATIVKIEKQKNVKPKSKINR